MYSRNSRFGVVSITSSTSQICTSLLPSFCASLKADSDMCLANISHILTATATAPGSTSTGCPSSSRKFCIMPSMWSQGKSTRCLLYTSPSPRDRTRSRMPSSA
eukprot:TRINITY_DN26324_c0_g1_i1.p1 TRINITY_DN26324_c0_g1~~TRINITY_DN26324_c0_g1_i1.p1  ORF type:complete len:104 (-),score=29.20 TRINITY_DN26324_c0_g1_i1:110-421(-)